MQLTKTSTETTRVNETLNIITIYVLSISFHSRAASRVKMFRSSSAKFSFMLHQVREHPCFTSFIKKVFAPVVKGILNCMNLKIGVSVEGVQG